MKNFIFFVGLMLSVVEANNIIIVRDATLLHEITFDRVNIENIITFTDDKDCRFHGMAKNEIDIGRVFVKLNKKTCLINNIAIEQKIDGFAVDEDEKVGLSIDESFQDRTYHAVLKLRKKVTLVIKMEELKK